MKQQILPLAIYDTKEVSEILSLSDLSVQGYIRQEKIKASKVGNGYRVLGKDLLEFLSREGPSLEMACFRLEQALVLLNLGHTPQPGEDNNSPFHNTSTTLKEIVNDGDTKADVINTLAGFIFAAQKAIGDRQALNVRKGK